MRPGRMKRACGKLAHRAPSPPPPHLLALHVRLACTVRHTHEAHWPVAHSGHALACSQGRDGSEPHLAWQQRCHGSRLWCMEHITHVAAALGVTPCLKGTCRGTAPGWGGARSGPPPWKRALACGQHAAEPCCEGLVGWKVHACAMAARAARVLRVCGVHMLCEQ